MARLLELFGLVGAGAGAFYAASLFNSSVAAFVAVMP